MITRGWWPLQRWFAARRVFAVVLACVPTAALAIWWRPPATLLPTVVAFAVAMLAPVVIARGSGSRRRLAGRATGASLVIAQPLIIGAVFVDVELLMLIFAAGTIAVLAPAVVPVHEPTAGSELPPESESSHGSWMVPLGALVAVGVAMTVYTGIDVPVLHLDASMLATVAGCSAIWLAITMRPLFGLAIAISTLVVLVLASGTSAVASPATVALALTTPLVAWFHRESAGGFPAWTPAVVAVATVAVYAPDPAWPVLAMLTATTWLIAATYPVSGSRTEPEQRSAAGIIAWSQRVFGGLEPYWRFYARGKLANDPIYGRLAGDERAWGRVLDAGCGPGLTAAVAAGRADTTEYLGIDLDIDKLLVARRALRLSGRMIGSATWRLRRDRFPLAIVPPTRFDTVLVLDILHYWPDDVQATTLAQLASLLGDDGRLYLREGVAADDGDAGAIERGERFTTFFGLNPENPLRFLPAARITALIAAAGLAIESEEQMGSENRLWVCRRI